VLVLWSCVGIWSLSPRSLGLRELFADVIGGVLNRGGVKGLSGAGLGIRGETSGVLPYTEDVSWVDSAEFPCALL
jgi:hypothetical protein